VFQRLLRKISRELRNNSIPYMVIGGQAVLIYGEPRLTRDIDITLGMGTEGLAKLLQSIGRLNLRVLVQHEDEFVTRTMVLPTLEEESGIRVDFIFSFSHYERQALQRAVQVKLGRTTVQFASLEDVIVHKIIAGRPRDIEDVRSILIKNPDYDLAYIEKWLKEFDASLNKGFLEAFRSISEETSRS
jgi:predicted nucleotidyltransferase